MIEVLAPGSAAQLGSVRQPMRVFVAWHRERHVQDLR